LAGYLFTTRKERDRLRREYNNDRIGVWLSEKFPTSEVSNENIIPVLLSIKHFREGFMQASLAIS